ncbi:MAG: hypothetical protein K6G47_05915 [Clostridia bacterium]|nr:hypothetical protein [Clostridia bacterium]
MATLKSYSCSECGGVLNYDKDQELFGCPFCGADFAVGNIHRDELLKDVEIRLNNLEFHAAREKIDSILEQYPNDPLVLRDLVLCEGRCNSVDNLDHPGKMSSCDFVKMEQAAFEVQERCDVKDKAYFAKLIEMIRMAHKYSDLSSGVKAVPKAGTDQFKELAKAGEDYKRSVENSKVILFGSQGQNSEDDSSGLLVVGGIIVLAVFFIGGKKAGFIALAIFAAIIALYLLLSTLIRRAIYRHKATPHRKDLDTLHQYEDSSTAELGTLESTYETTYKRFKQITPAGDREAAEQRPRAPKIPMAELIDFDKKIVCSNCGGNLIADKDRMLYECKFCGVAYGSSLFFGQPFKKALEAIGVGEYIEADQRFTHMLMLDPHDFNALLGRFLCAGKWKKIEELTLAHSIPQIRLKNLKERIDEIVPQASDEDREYFADLQRMINDRLELSELETDLNRLKKGVTGNESEFHDRNRLTADFNDLRDKVLRANRDLDFISGIPMG